MAQDHMAAVPQFDGAEGFNRDGGRGECDLPHPHEAEARYLYCGGKIQETALETVPA
jgi:hypothetical protein